MKNVKRLSQCVLFLATVALCQADVILSIDPSSQTVPLGLPASFNLDVSGLGNGTALGTYDINFGFDPTLLSYSTIAFGNQLNVLGLGDIQNVTPGTGTVEVFELSLDSPSDLNSLQAHSFTLATLTFNSLAAGINSPITLSVNALGDAFGSPIPPTLQNGSVSIYGTAVVPEPSPLPMMVCVIAILFAATIKRRLSGWRPRCACTL